MDKIAEDLNGKKSDNSFMTKCACAEVRKAARALTKIYNKHLAPAGLKVAQFSLLMTIRVGGSITMSRLARVAIIDRTTLVRNLAILEKKGLISTKPVEGKREHSITLTDAGGRKCEEAIPLWEKAQGQVVAFLGPENVNSLMASISGIKSLARGG